MTAKSVRRRRSWNAPEVIQTSAMDCGPASLKCVLEGFGISVSYDRLREACQTSLDGTSIDTLEEVAVDLGLDAKQVLVPPDHVLDRDARLTPAIAVTKLPGGNTHFAVIWRRHRGWFSIMDPAQGRRRISASSLLSQLHDHSMIAPAEDWRAWAGTDEFTGPLTRQLAKLGLNAEACARRIAAATADPSWRSLAILDAATRMLVRLRQTRAMVRAKADDVLGRVVLDTATAVSSGENLPIPPRYWSARPSRQPDHVVIRGAVLIKIGGVGSGPIPAEADLPHLSAELRAALRERPTAPLRELASLMKRDGLLVPGVLAVAALVAGAGVLLEAVMFRALLDLVRDLGTTRQRLGGAAALVGFVILLLGIQLPSVKGWLRSGRRLELELRQTFLRKLPHIRERYFQSRLASDMAERAHAVHTLRSVPVVGGSALTTAFSLAFTMLGILWLDPDAWPYAISLGVVAVGMPLWIQRQLRDDDMKFRTRAGALARHYLDALVGLIPIRTHGAEGTVWREHQEQLDQWIGNGMTLQGRAVVLGALQTAISFALAAALLYGHLERGGSVGAVLLLVYWALQMPVLGDQLTQFLLQYPQQRNVTARLLEPLGAGEEPVAGVAPGIDREHGSTSTGVAIDFREVTVLAGGHPILEDITCQVGPGEHIAVVGPSGAGKSTLVGLLLGLHTPASGHLRVDGKPLEKEQLLQLRGRTAWLDPAVALWNRSFVDNLTYGTGSQRVDALGDAIRGAELQDLLEHLPEGLQTQLGEAGAFVSGGEGQRVRLGRAMLRTDARLVVLDEPFRGLHRAMRRSLLERVRRRWSTATVLCITHDLDETLDFSRVLVVDGGRIVEDGPPRQLARQADTRFAELLRAEAQVADLWRGPEWRNAYIDEGRLHT